MTGLYADDSLHIRQGTFRWYLDGGTIYQLSTYKADTLDGLEINYYFSGKEKLKGLNKGKQRVGQWTAYFPSGKLAGKAVYQGGKQTSLTLFKEDGSRNVKDTIFERDSEFPGGSPGFLRFLNKTLRYPDSAVIHEIQGTVVIRFGLSKEGKVSYLKVTQSVDTYLDAEALRVMNLMPDWYPAVVAGVPVESFHVQPIVFSYPGQ